MSNASSESTIVTTNESATTGPGAWPWHPLQIVVLAIAVFILASALTLVLTFGSVSIYANLHGANSVQVDLWLNSTLGQFLSIAITEILVMLGVAWLLKRHKLSLKALGFGRRPRRKDALFTLLAFAVYTVVLITGITIIGKLVPGIDSGQQDIGFNDAHGFGQLSLVFAALVIFAPVAEETLFRGFLFGGLRKRWGWLPAATLTSLLFGAAHLAGSSDGWSAPLWSAGFDTLILSFALCYLRERTGALWSGIMLHMLKNGIAFYLAFVIHFMG